MHANGEGVAQDYVQALTLITRAARNGFAEAEPVAERLRAQMSPDQLAEVDRRLGN
jgi:TPR repeat protein